MRKSELIPNPFFPFFCNSIVLCIVQRINIDLFGCTIIFSCTIDHLKGSLLMTNKSKLDFQFKYHFKILLSRLFKITTTSPLPDISPTYSPSHQLNKLSKTSFRHFRNPTRKIQPTGINPETFAQFEESIGQIWVYLYFLEIQHVKLLAQPADWRASPRFQPSRPSGPSTP